MIFKSGRKSSKGIAATLELIAVMVALFVSFNVFFPGATYKNNWEDAYAVLLSRDMMASLVATDDLHAYMTDPSETAIRDFFDSVFPQSNLVFWYETEGIKDNIDVACACSNEQIQKLEQWTDGLEINGQPKSISVCQANLGSPGSCIADSDLMVIWNYAALDQLIISNYLIEDKGIIEIRDFAADPDLVHELIFGINGSGTGVGAEDVIVEPFATEEITYQAYKYFHHIPLSLVATGGDSIPDVCGVSRKGLFKINGQEHAFWVCDSSTVYFDSIGTISPDIGPLNPDDTFMLQGFDFELSYIDNVDKIRITFLDTTQYRFEDFADSGGMGIIPNDDDDTRVLVQMSGAADDTQSAVILNSVYGSRVVWIADFARNGIDASEIGDDHRHITTSLIVWASKKSEKSEYIDIQRGYTTSYISVNNTDVFEIKKYEVGVGYPY